MEQGSHCGKAPENPGKDEKKATRWELRGHHQPCARSPNSLILILDPKEHKSTAMVGDGRGRPSLLGPKAEIQKCSNL